MVCLDTDIIIDFLRNEKNAIKIIRNLWNKNIELSTTSINTFELFKGALESNNKEDQETVHKFISNLKILNFDLNSSKKAAGLFKFLKTKGELIDPADLMIASTAVINNEKLLTRNAQHFKRISELELVKF